MALTPDPARDEAEAFAVCPSCGLVAPPEPGEHEQPAGTRVAAADVDWSRPVQVRCQYCGQRHQLSRSVMPPLDEVATCPACATHTPCPGEALRVACRACGESYPGPNVGGPMDGAPGRRRRELAEGYHEIDDQLWQ